MIETETFIFANFICHLFPKKKRLNIKEETFIYQQKDKL